ncbi:DUF6298 domain-containing protein [Echinicola jeungdonensis]|uniref:DUF6298 domain-containing protein n=1 Tax=Echinicola jeungdonensis TaxID=709343 RepID=A0ABV5J3L1_9BACT|nr:DUF6298 domain-containing protein [Echinicola jeungdonensis]MDN3668207.1 DUF6298 domain-containing protein [Echinicola jeungdonensis]
MDVKYGMNLLLGLFAFALPVTLLAQSGTSSNAPIQINEGGILSYKVEGDGDQIPDYSFCGYMLSENPIPDVPVKVIVRPKRGDATAEIQAAIDYVATLPLDDNGFRGTVLLEKGTFEISGGLTIRSSGVVLRGSGSGKDGSLLIGSGVDRQTLIRIAGVNNLKKEDPIPLVKSHFPVNATTLTFDSPHSFKVGDSVIVNRPSTEKWIKDIGADKIGIHVDYPLTKWESGDFDQNWFREVVAVSPQSIILDVPLTNSLDPKYGGGSVAKYSWEGQISQVGVENLRCISAFDPSNEKDENHRWMAVTMENVRDSWVRRMVAEHFVSSAVAIWEKASRITVEDCKSLAPVGQIGGYRRYAFQTLGQQVLFQRCYSEYAFHAYSVGFTTPGPNAFVQCHAYMPYNFSGTIGGWASGVLFDKVSIDGGNISLAYRDVDGQGGGWSAANSLIWQSKAAKIFLSSPPGAENWAYAYKAQGYGKGHHELATEFVKPESLFYAQLRARTGQPSPEEEKILQYETSRTNKPSPEQAAQLSEQSKYPDLTMEGWIDQMVEKYPIHSELSEAKMVNQVVSKVVQKSPKKNQKGAFISIKNGWLLSGNQVLTGKRDRTSLWRGTTRPNDIESASPNLVRFVPGRIGRGLTDNLDTLVYDMLQHDVVAMQSFPALWYERRRDDHSRSRRADADVWAPFYEQPFSRSGQGEAYDRLSKYDLTKWNTWYWLRLNQFANLADQNGLLYIQEHYLQHNILEEAAHWADYPWRTANNINQSGFAEPPAYAGDKRVYMAESFYDTTHQVRNTLHRAYIKKSLDNFKGNTNIIHHLGVEYTGPLHFVQFWLDVIGEWERENQQEVMVLLPGTKDVQDAILEDPKLSTLVDGIDVIQWQYRKDGSLYAPEGGQNLAGRQYARLIDPGEPSFDQIYRAVQEFRTKYPEKAIVYSRRGVPFKDWAVFIGGGSLAELPEIQEERFFRDAAIMKPLTSKNLDSSLYVLGQKGTGYVLFLQNGELKIDLTDDQNRYTLKWIDPTSGEITEMKKEVKGGMLHTLAATMEVPVVAWLVKN